MSVIMSLLLCRASPQNIFPKIGVRCMAWHGPREVENDGEFRILRIRPRPRSQKSKRLEVKPPKVFSRNARMDPNNLDWKSIWPGPRSFHPDAVPLPLRQGHVDGGTPFTKDANPELMKIPNFLHLTPPAIEAHCKEIKKFCSPFPKALDTMEKCDEHFPMTVTTHDYLHSSPSIRDPLARVVNVKIKLKSLPLDEHARDKFLRLVGDRHDPKSDILTIVTDCCPLRKQNYEYAQYLLTALFYESWKVEAWESQKTELDMEKFVWENSVSALTLADIVTGEKKPLEKLTPIQFSYKAAVTEIVEGENENALDSYKQSTTKLLLKKSADANSL